MHRMEARHQRVSFADVLLQSPDGGSSSGAAARVRTCNVPGDPADVVLIDQSAATPGP
jgi:hypothetical protein